MIRLLPPKAHSSVERAALIGGVMMRKVPTDHKYAVRGEMLKKMVEEDKAAGLIPFYVRKYKSWHPSILLLYISTSFFFLLSYTFYWIACATCTLTTSCTTTHWADSHNDSPPLTVMLLCSPWGLCWGITLFLLNLIYVYLVKDNNPCLIWMHRSLSVHIIQGLHSSCSESSLRVKTAWIYIWKGSDVNPSLKAICYSSCTAAEFVCHFLPLLWRVQRKWPTYKALWSLNDSCMCFVSVLCDSWHHSIVCFWSHHWVGPHMWVTVLTVFTFKYTHILHV